MWTSKLGTKYPQSEIEEQDRRTHYELKQLRGKSGNTTCADCGVKDTTWASVNHGVFICVACSDVHRSVGTHITKVKGCTGTYLWGPDELAKMQAVGNCNAEQIYGDTRVKPDDSKATKQQFVTDKYERKLFAPADVGDDTRVAVPQPPAAGDASGRGSGPAAPLQVTRPNLLPTVGKGAMHKPAPVAHVSVAPDSLFDELFADWTAPALPKKTSSEVKEAPATKTSDIPEDLFRDNVCVQAPSAVQPQSRLSKAAQLLVDDDIFAIFK
jgi:hypothetical protein